ncbi:extracellular solute-binding protein [Mycobacterium sp. PSTR-4-N]|uniref:ABC transporter substrate-binding protein n=1 Tax=Mycobacterium sp. PSTR-4-N TaxID=2917745 RepID=UPI001F1521C9|nr:extracellular solute-binding protein [Mycobacterium sp. PSTR-4-N]MCG7592802.1 ABC transporter substrate-binding protein [Mycobacterium sp. PSTR-4-N]
MIRRRLCIALLAVIALVLAGCGGGGSSSSGPTEIAVWHGYQDTEGEVFKNLIAQYNKDHPDVKVNQLYSSNDLVLQKVLTAVRGGSAPDVAYMFGSWSPNIAQIPQVVDMADEVKKPDWQWDDFYPAEREAATVGEKVVGVPALVDNLAIVYNKKLFADAGVAPPSPDWTWDDFRAAAAKLTDPSKGQYGWLIPADGSEDTVWHYIPMLWEAGGDILSPDNEKAVFNSEAGVKALTVLQQMAVQDKSLYLDTTNENGPKLMNSGKVAMLVTGPWDLSQLTDIDYDVQVMPTFAGSNGGHQTIAGPDNWVVFDNGDKKKQAAVDFVKWLSAPEQVKAFSLGTGDLPIRQSVGKDQEVLDKLNQNVPGTAAFVENLNNVKKVRPTVEQYPDVSDALGQAIVAVMLGKQQPADALNAAAQAADAKLAEK